MTATVCWREWDGEGLEHCACRLDAAGLMLEGVVAGTHEGLDSGFSAEIEVDAAGLVLDYPGVFRRLRRP